MAARKTSPTTHDLNQGQLPGIAAPLPLPPAPTGHPGSMGIGTRICGLVTVALDKARLEKRLSRAMVAAAMSELTGCDISEHMLNACSAQSKEGHRLPLEWVPALVYVTGDDTLLHTVAEALGAVALFGDAAIAARVAELEQASRQTKSEADRLRKFITPGRR